MNVVRSTWRVCLLLAAVFAVTVILAQESRPAAAAGSQVFFSKVNTAPTKVTSVIIQPSTGYKSYYIWGKDLKGTYGAGYMQLDIRYISYLLHTGSLAEGDPFDGLLYSGWLGTTGRSDQCGLPLIINGISGAGQAQIICDTLGAPMRPPPPPWGPLGTTIIGSLTIRPGTVLGTTTVAFEPVETWIKDTGEAVDNNADTIVDQVIEPANIPLTVSDLTVVIARCGNVDLDPVYPPLGGGAVDIDDIFVEAAKFGQTTYHPTWDPMFDMDGNGAVGIDDIFLIVLMYSTYCMPTP